MLEQCIHKLDASHVFIGIGGFLLTAETFYIIDTQVHLPLCTLIGCATVIFYGIHRLVQIKKYEDIASERMLMLNENRSVIVGSVLVAFVCALAFIYIYFFDYWYIWLGLGILSVLYLFPWLTNRTRVRDLPYIKIFVIATIWVLITVGIPLLILNIEMDIAFFLMLERFFFFLLITLPFDKRDKIEDEVLGVKTLATSMSFNNLFWLGMSIFLIHSCIVWLAPFTLQYTLILQFVGVCGLLLLWKTKIKQALWYYSFLLDGLISMRMVLLWILAYFFGM